MPRDDRGLRAARRIGPRSWLTVAARARQGGSATADPEPRTSERHQLSTAASLRLTARHDRRRQARCRTEFAPEQLADPRMAASEKILHTCVHCGFCTATCPTYLLLGDELDGPRGRIYLIKDMLENGKPATKEVVTHVDRCLSCLSCMTTCPSGVHYMHLVDHARAYIEETYTPLLARPADARRCWRRSCPIPTASASRCRRRCSAGRSGRSSAPVRASARGSGPMLDLAPRSLPATPTMKGRRRLRRRAARARSASRS